MIVETESNWHTVNRGCPQGSALSPLLWNILENDLTDEIKSGISLYADDHQLYEMGKDLAKVKSSLAVNAEKVSRWYEVNLLRGNFSRYKTMLMHNDDKVTSSLSLNIQGNEIELKDKLKVCGGDLTFFKNFAVKFLPTGKSFQSIAAKFPHPGLHIAVKYPKGEPKKGTIKISSNKLKLRNLYL